MKNEVADARLTYLPSPLLPRDGVGPVVCPSAPRWPRPRAPLPPFTGGLVDYVRALGPGVYAGVGFKGGVPGGEAGTPFLPFVMVRRPGGGALGCECGVVETGLQ